MLRESGGRPDEEVPAGKRERGDVRRHVGDEIHGRGAATGVASGLLVALEQQYLVILCEKAGGRGAGNAGADDDDVDCRGHTDLRRRPDRRHSGRVVLVPRWASRPQGKGPRECRGSSSPDPRWTLPVRLSPRRWNPRDRPAHWRP